MHYLFSEDHKEVSDVEVLVMLTPEVIRLPDRPGEKNDASLVPGEGSSTPAETPGGSGFDQPFGFPSVPETPQGGPQGPPSQP